MSNPRLNPLALTLLGVGLLASLCALTHRFRAERNNRAVELVVDLGQLRILCTNSGHPIEKALADFKRAGANGVAVAEAVVQDLASAGQIRAVRYASRGSGRVATFAVDDPILYERVERSFGAFLPHILRGAAADMASSGVRIVGPGGRAFVVPGAAWEDLSVVPVGLDPEEIRLVRSMGLDPIARLYNFVGATPASIHFALQSLPGYGIRRVIFVGEDVLGFRGRMADTADALKRFGLLYGPIELPKQRGDEALSEKVEDRLIRVHSVQFAEMIKMSDREVVDRYVRAVDERNIRLGYVRLITSVTENPYEDNQEYVRQLAAGIDRAGFRRAPAHAFAPVWPDERVERLLLALIGLGAGAAGLLLLASLLPLSPGTQAALTLLFGAAGAGMLAVGGHLGREVVALGTALVFPTLAFVWVPQPLGALAAEPGVGEGWAQRFRSVPLRALAQFGVMCAISGLGALMVAAILSDRAYMLKLESFVGIKVAHVLPALFVAIYYLLGPSNRGPWEKEKERLAERSQAVLAEPLRVWQALAMLVALAALGLLVLRTGNEPGMAVSPVEMKFRSLLEDYLVRPRTKEFLIGHPALLVGLAMAATARWRRWALLPLLIGAIGQVSIVNSFCHIHTPLALSVARTFNGIWIGALLGLLVIALGSGLTPRLRWAARERQLAAG